MQVTIGASIKADISAAVNEVVSKCTNPNLLILLSPYDYLKEASSLVSSKFPDVPLIGTSTTTYYGSESSDRRMILISFGSDVDAEVGIIRNLSSAPMLDIVDMEKKVSAIQPGDQNTVCIEFCCNDEERLVTTLNVALEHSKIPIVGGTIFGQPDGCTAFAMCNGKLYSDACCYALIKNKTGKIRTYSENIFGPMACGKTHIATKVNLTGKELISLDGRPAADVYCEDAGVSRAQLVDNVLVSPLGRVIGDEIFITSPYGIGENGSLVSYKKINENDTIEILELKDYDEIGNQTRNKIRQENNKISLIFSINCIYRHMLFTQKNYLTDYLTAMKSVGLHVGVVGGGEQHKKQHVNQTMVCAVFE